jgi:hypothetical protein
MNTPRSRRLQDGSLLEWEVRSGLLGPYPASIRHNGQDCSREAGEMLQRQEGFCLSHDDDRRDPECRHCAPYEPAGRRPRV